MYMYVHVDWGELWLVDAESAEVCMTQDKAASLRKACHTSCTTKSAVAEKKHKFTDEKSKITFVPVVFTPVIFTPVIKERVHGR